MTNIASFLDYLRAELNRSERTVENYAVALREFEAFFHSLAEGMRALRGQRAEVGTLDRRVHTLEPAIRYELQDAVLRCRH